MLHKTIKDFFSRYYGRNLSEEEMRSIDTVIESHGMDPKGLWLIALFENLQGKSPNARVELIKPNYPDGENGFANLLADLKQDFGFDLGDYADYGEGISWTLQRLGLKFFLSHEGAPDYYRVESLSG